MFIYKGGQTVKKGLYLQAGKCRKMLLREGGVLPGTEGTAYFRFSESCLLVILLSLAVVIPLVLPLRTEFVMIIFLFALVIALYVAGFACSMIIKKVLGRSATFGYRPATAYMVGNKPKKKEQKGRSTEQY
ncbi:MAG TPA: hypothetical protein VMB78_02880 [Dissulfurispiraceae bacterium]|nr:hypothetical protein [Dissulfurispiraceae bacterium]